MATIIMSWYLDGVQVIGEYCFNLPRMSEDIVLPQEGLIGVYLCCSEYGLRFPLDKFVLQLLNAYNACLAQQLSLFIYWLLGFIWVCPFMHFVS